MDAPAWSCPPEQVRRGPCVKALPYFSHTEAAAGIRVCGPVYGYQPFPERTMEGYLHFSRTTYSQLPKKHVLPLGTLEMTQLPTIENPDLAQQS